jgi:hypothetical protein
MEMRVLVCGDRDYTDGDLIKSVLAEIHKTVEKIAVVIEGGCRGADLLAKQAACDLGIPVREFPADWQKYGRAAGPIRNRQMLVEGCPHVVLAFHECIAESHGTLDMVRRAAKAANVVVMVIPDQPIPGCKNESDH